MRRKAIVGILLCMIVLAIPVSSGAGWYDPDGFTFNPYTVYQGEPTQFTFTIYNQASGSMDVYYVFVHFCWLPSNTGYYFKNDDGSKDHVAGHGSRSYTKTIWVDETELDLCDVEIKVRGKAVGDLFAETHSYYDYIDINSIPTLSVSASGNPNSGDYPLTVYFQCTHSGGLSPYSYSWTFGDGSTSSQKNPSHKYTSAGTYTAKVIVTEGSHLSMTDSDTVMVTVTTPPTPPPNDGIDGTDDGTTDGTNGDGTGIYQGTTQMVLWIALLVGIIITVVSIITYFATRKKPPQKILPPPPPP